MTQPLLTRKRQLAFKEEAVEGTAETLSAAYAGMWVEMTPQAAFDPQMTERNPARSTLSKKGQIVGKRPGSHSFKFRLRGSGSLTTEAKNVPLLKACGFEVSDLEKITIGAVSDGPFTHLETITGGTSSSTGKVICETADGTTTLYFVTLTGTFQSGEVVTGGTSGATATTGSAPADSGHVLLPVSALSSVPTLTMGLYEDGIRKLIRGARGSMKFALVNGQPVDVDCTFQGVEAGITDTAMLSGVDYEDTVEPAFLGASLTIDDVAMKYSTLNLDWAAELAARDDPSDSRGLLSYYIKDRNPVGDIDAEMLAVATHDFHGKWFAGTKMKLDVSFGDTDGNKFRFYCPQVQYTKIDDGDREGLALAQSQFQMCSYLDAGDDELAILML